ncbi:MAG: DUF4199 domain-containing protein [Chitinophagaceae bacterium]|nr:DUF4199 domain-containing protein [Chitinophagaceae bacterium]
MKKIILVCGLIAGSVLSIVMIVSFLLMDDHFSGGMLLGYASMLLSFSLIFVAIKTWRDKYNNGIISFGKAFKIGLLISLIASAMYVITWMIEYTFFIPDFMEKYAAHTIEKAKAAGATAAEISKQTTEMEKFKVLYKNPFFVVLMTFAEVLPVGLIVSLIAALILKRKSKAPHPATASTAN